MTTDRKGLRRTKKLCLKQSTTSLVSGHRSNLYAKDELLSHMDDIYKEHDELLKEESLHSAQGKD